MDGFNLEENLSARREAGLYRHRKTLESPQAPNVIVDGKPYLSFCSNDYLGLANHPNVIASLKRATDKYGVGGGASHLVSGHSRPHHQLEDELAALTGRDRVLLFSSGYMANQGVISGLLGKQDAVFQDRLNHASLLDAGLLSGARFQRYLHNNVASLDSRLERTTARRKLVVSDGVFSMDGDVAPIPTLIHCAKQHNAWLMIDDAHGFGVLGKQGGGIAEQFSLSQEDLPVLVGTLGKSFGTSGAFVAGSNALIETLIQFARSYIYTTAMPPAVAAATSTSLKLLQEEHWRREHLNHLITFFRAESERIGIRLMDSYTPIQPILVDTAENALAMSQSLAKQGIMVTAIRPPTVPEGTSRLRITFSATHSQEHVERLLEALEQTVKSLGEMLNTPTVESMGEHVA